MKRLFWLLWLAVLAAAACSSEPAPPPTLPADAAPTLLQIGVTSGASPIIPLIESVYTQDNPQIKLQFVVANSAALIGDLKSGLLDAALLHHIPEDDARYFNPIAVDGLVIVVHADNPIRSLTQAEVQAIFSGRFTEWQAVGGPQQEIVLLNREQGSGLRTLLRQQIMAEQRLTPNALLQTGNEAMLTAVATNPAAIGFSSMGSASQAPSVKMLQIEGISANPATTTDQTYPLTTPLYFLAATEDEPAGELRAFLAWLQSEAGQKVIEVVYGRVR